MEIWRLRPSQVGVSKISGNAVLPGADDCLIQLQVLNQKLTGRGKTYETVHMHLAQHSPVSHLPSCRFSQLRHCERGLGNVARRYAANNMPASGCRAADGGQRALEQAQGSTKLHSALSRRRLLHGTFLAQILRPHTAGAKLVIPARPSSNNLNEAIRVCRCLSMAHIAHQYFCCSYSCLPHNA